MRKARVDTFSLKTAFLLRNKGVEYGSARWGTAEDIKPYTDPVFQNNVLLTQTERLSMNSRPKQPKYARNKNISPGGAAEKNLQN